MQNVDMKVKGDVLTITVDLKQTFGPSASGKTTCVASTKGGVPCPSHPDIKVSLNIYK